MLIGFDETIQKTLRAEMESSDITINDDGIISKVEKQDNDKVTITFKDGETITDVDALIWAIGRVPNTDNMGLENTQIEKNS